MKKILILSDNNFKKDRFLINLFKFVSIQSENLYKNDFFATSINYSEKIISFNNENYLLINLPCIFPNFFFSKKNKESLIWELNYFLKSFISSADDSYLSLWILSSSVENNIKITKFFIDLNKPLLIISFFNDDYEKDKLNKFKSGFFLDFFEISKEKVSIFFQKINLLLGISKISGREIIPKLNKISFVISIFGPPNSGKSTLMNSILKKERSLTHHLSGTTKEAVTSFFSSFNIDNINLIDTFGIDNKKKIDWKIIKKSDLLFLVIDVSEFIGKKIFNLLEIAKLNSKSFIIILNKLDLIKDIEMKKIILNLRIRLKSMKFVPIISVSALEKKGIGNLIKLIHSMYVESIKKISKSELTNLIEIINSSSPIRQLKIYFIKNLGGWSPKFIIFVNNKKKINFSYERFISNFLREKFNLRNLFIQLIFKQSS